jgi:tetratricopeptide (TPR) repeat protein
MPGAVISQKAALGYVHFPIFCKPEVQAPFDAGVALLHSFEFREAEAAFRNVEHVDPRCVIAGWGIALSTTERSGANAPQKDLAKGWTELHHGCRFRQAQKASRCTSMLSGRCMRAIPRPLAASDGTDINWKDAAQIEPPSSSSFEENFDAYWSEAIGAARSGDPQKARLALENYRKSSQIWDKQHGWGDILGVALTQAEAWTLFAEGKRDGAVTSLRNIAQFERDHPMYYADILPRPSAEMLGDMLLEMSKPDEALEASKSALALAPKRFDSLIGARKAAEQLHNKQMAQQYTNAIRKEGATLAPRS